MPDQYSLHNRCSKNLVPMLPPSPQVLNRLGERFRSLTLAAR